MNKNVLMAAIAAAGLLVVGGANAATDTTTFQVTATVAQACLIDSAGGVAFGTYTPGLGDKTASGSVGVRCSSGLGFTLALNAGANSSGSFAPRLMKDGGSNTLQYNLYKNTSTTTVWGDGTASTETVPGTGIGMASGNVINFAVEGRLPDNATNQAAPAGSYADTITVTLTY